MKLRGLKSLRNERRKSIVIQQAASDTPICEPVILLTRRTHALALSIHYRKFHGSPAFNTVRDSQSQGPGSNSHFAGLAALGVHLSGGQPPPNTLKRGHQTGAECQKDNCWLKRVKGTHPARRGKSKLMPAASLRACFKNRPIRGPGLQRSRLPAVSCRPRALTRRVRGFLKHALNGNLDFITPATSQQISGMQSAKGSSQHITPLKGALRDRGEHLQSTAAHGPAK